MDFRSDAPFPVTRWSLVAGARAAADPRQKRAALEDLCALYWKPIYGFLRRRGVPVEEARDATQGFFVSLLEEDLFAKAQADSGRMRSYLLGALQRWQRGEWRKTMAEKRGGGREVFSLDAMAEADDFEAAGNDHDTPEHHFEKSCALAMLESAMRRLADEQKAAGKADAFAVLRPLLAPLSGEPALSHEEAASRLRCTPEALRVTLHRLRKRFAEVLRASVADTLAEPTPEAIQEELDALRAALSQ
ncbi:sigma-70 family RNA polymerase sigma factor [Luteolibacter flavescens]|uniref:Sigma-70 family RNA polymerase sigma factor n=1 Tax=Luteolibacter flavescens TaxID=1859460 RepID=A0ABT3FP04_9BACT|nr:sigma-70 family RNA polymerase sigma factor [Luteolibacter flavescens]MCW1885305.1 sigma-70 family RNA polymerase sigma factor [Luteolibacter flavescens]